MEKPALISILEESGLVNQINFIESCGYEGVPKPTKVGRDTILKIQSLPLLGDPFDIVGHDGLYMRRNHLIDPSFGAVGARKQTIERSDAARDLHCHPFHNVSVLLAGEGYWEVFPDKELNIDALPIELRKDFKSTEPVRVEKREVGDVICRMDYYRHRLLLAPGTTTTSCFITSRKTKPWGFFTIHGWIFNEFYDEMDDEATMKAKVKMSKNYKPLRLLFAGSSSI